MTNKTTINLVKRILELDETHIITGWSYKTNDVGNITFEFGMISKREDAFD